MNLTDWEEQEVKEALHFHADALRRQAKGRKEAGGGAAGKEHRDALRGRARDLRVLANRIGRERELRALAAEVEAGAERARERARLRVEPGERVHLSVPDSQLMRSLTGMGEEPLPDITWHNRDND